MKVDGIHYRTIWMTNSTIHMINQPLIPHRFEIADLNTTEEVKNAICNMTIRGAGAIGAAGAYGIAQAALQANDDELFERAPKGVFKNRDNSSSYGCLIWIAIIIAVYLFVYLIN